MGIEDMQSIDEKIKRLMSRANELVVDADELARLRRRVAELEEQNRRLHAIIEFAAVVAVVWFSLSAIMR